MFDNTLFFSPFWSGLIVFCTLGGIAGMFWLISWMSKGSSKSEGDDGKVTTMGHVWDEDLAEYSNPLPRWWLWMFYITLVFGIIYLILFPGLGSYAGVLKWSEVGQYQQEVDEANAQFGPIYDKFKSEPIEQLVKNEHALKIGHRLFMTYCTVCHGSDARGVPGKGFPNLRDNDWLWGGQPDVIETTIMGGRNPPDAPMVMMAWKDIIGGEEAVKNVAQYVISLNPTRASEVDAAAAEKGKVVFGGTCSACHGPDGKGTPALGAPNLTDDVWLYGGKKEQIETSVAKGRKGTMPAHGEFLGPAKVHLLAAYIYSLSQNSSGDKPAQP
jgi:cytochrome c oxidase cbb3-type subunit 3